MPGLSLWQATSYAGMTESKRNSAFLMYLINAICLKHNENARTRQGKMSVRLQECRMRQMHLAGKKIKGYHEYFGLNEKHNILFIMQTNS